jgi:hypothetical protein
MQGQCRLGGYMQSRDLGFEKSQAGVLGKLIASEHEYATAKLFQPTRLHVFVCQGARNSQTLKFLRIQWSSAWSSHLEFFDLIPVRHPAG